MWGSLWSSTPTAMDSYSAEDALWYLAPTTQQQAALQEFRARLDQECLLVAGHDDDYTLLRFLMARDFKLDKALAMYRDMRHWRQENGVNGLYESDPNGSAYPNTQQLLQVYPHFYFNTDKFGRPVYVELLGRTDATALFNTITVDQLIRYHIWTWERYLRCYLPACSAAAGRHICTTTVIIDLAGLSLSNFNGATQKLLSTFSKIDQDYYPEHLGTMFVINTPLIFRGIWAAVQPLLQERTRKKIVILGSDYLTELTKMVPIERLPDIFGGQMKLDPTYKSVGPWQQQQQQQPQPQLQQEPQALQDGARAQVGQEPAGAAGERGTEEDRGDVRQQDQSQLEETGADARVSISAGGREADGLGKASAGLAGARKSVEVGEDRGEDQGEEVERRLGSSINSSLVVRA